MLVAEVSKGGPADKAGVRVGDIILRFNGHPIDDNHRLPRMVADTAIGSAAEITVFRDGREQSLTATVARLEPQGPKSERHRESTAEPGSLGLTLAPLTAETRSELGLEAGATGVLVRGVEPGSDAAERGIEPGDVVQMVDQHAVTTPQDVRHLLEAARQAKRASVLLLLRHGEGSRFVALPLTVAGK